MRKNISFLMSILFACGPTIKNYNESSVSKLKICWITKTEAIVKPDLEEFQAEINDFFLSEEKTGVFYLNVISGKAGGTIKRIGLNLQYRLTAYTIKNGERRNIALNDESVYRNLIQDIPSGSYLQTCPTFSSGGHLTLLFIKRDGRVVSSFDYDDLKYLDTNDIEQFKDLIELDRLLGMI